MWYLLVFGLGVVVGHFGIQKCINGISYSYVKDTKDIYDKTLLCGDGNSINNMYNEYNS